MLFLRLQIQAGSRQFDCRSSATGSGRYFTSCLGTYSGFKDNDSEEPEKNTIKLEEHPVKEEAPLQNVSLAVEEKKVVNENRSLSFTSRTCSAASSVRSNICSRNYGKGIAIEPNENRVISPIAGTVMVLPDSQHAIGIKGEDGEEILIHIGIDTVSLKGEHFKALVKEKDYVDAGSR